MDEKNKIKEELTEEFKNKDKNKLDPSDEDKLKAVPDPQLRFALKDILFKLDYSEKRLTELTAKRPKEDEKKIEDTKQAVEQLRRSKELLIEEFKKRGLKYSDIKVEPEKKCTFYKTCRNKIRMVNKERYSKLILPCYSCEFNTERRSLPDPRNEFIVIRKKDIPRHHKQLKISMSQEEWESKLVASTVGPEEQFLVLSLNDDTAQKCALNFLQERRSQYMNQLQKQYEEAQKSGQFKSRAEQAINSAVKNIVGSEGQANTESEVQDQESEAVGDGDDGGDKEGGGQEDATGTGSVSASGDEGDESPDVEEAEAENTEAKESGTTEPKEK